jgi:hypothetical protein
LGINPIRTPGLAVFATGACELFGLNPCRRHHLFSAIPLTAVCHSLIVESVASLGGKEIDGAIAQKSLVG